MIDFTDYSETITAQNHVFVVDDGGRLHGEAKTALGEGYSIIHVEGVEDAIMAMNVCTPQVIIVDVSIPEIDGYHVCRMLKNHPSTALIPTILVSDKGGIEHQLMGHDAGCDDYIARPFSGNELLGRLKNQVKLTSRIDELRFSAEYATNTAMSVMTNMGEMGHVLEGLRRFSLASSFDELADAIVSTSGLFGLQCVVQVRAAGEKVTSAAGRSVSCVESAVVDQMARMERIVQFKSRLSITYDHISLLINDMPHEDAERCGRFRDHLAMLVEGADIRARGLIAAEIARKKERSIEKSVDMLSEVLESIDEAQRNSKYSISLVLREMSDDVERALAQVSLSEAQEHHVFSAMQNGVNRLMAVITKDQHMQDKLSNIVTELSEAE